MDLIGRVKKIDEFDLNFVKENSSTGYILEVHHENPSQLHNLHNDYSLAPEKLKISQDMLSKYCSDIADKYGIKIGGVDKLVPTLRNKKKRCCPLQKSSILFVIRNEIE